MAKSISRRRAEPRLEANKDARKKLKKANSLATDLKKAEATQIDSGKTRKAGKIRIASEKKALKKAGVKGQKGLDSVYRKSDEAQKKSKRLSKKVKPTVKNVPKTPKKKK